jgi:hypothetical protein
MLGLCAGKRLPAFCRIREAGSLCRARTFSYGGAAVRSLPLGTPTTNVAHRSSYICTHLQVLWVSFRFIAVAFHGSGAPTGRDFLSPGRRPGFMSAPHRSGCITRISFHLNQADLGESGRFLGGIYVVAKRSVAVASTARQAEFCPPTTSWMKE